MCLLDDMFFCADCESTGVAFGKGRHKRAHALVCCQAPREAGGLDISHTAWLEGRLHAMENMMDAMHRASTHGLDALNGRIDKFSAQVDARNELAEKSVSARLDALNGRMSNIETMLALLLTRMGAER